MGADTKIEWATHTWNPWLGCQKVSAACDFCYAEDMMDRRYQRVHWGPGEDRVRTSAATWRAPFKWDRIAAQAGQRATVFCLSLGDIWDNAVDPLWRHEAFQVMEQTPHLTYLLLSKRIGNAIAMCGPMRGCRALPENAALGATMVTQEEWDRDLPKLIEAGRTLGARFTFASVEPMLGPIDACGSFPDWVIVGGESGPNARPMHPNWVRSLCDQCVTAGVAFHFKQWGEHSYETRAGTAVNLPDLANNQQALWGDGKTNHVVATRVGKKAAGRLLDGREWSEFPA